MAGNLYPTNTLQSGQSTECRALLSGWVAGRVGGSILGLLGGWPSGWQYTWVAGWLLRFDGWFVSFMTDLIIPNHK